MHMAAFTLPTPHFAATNVRAVQLARVERNAAQRFRFMICQRRDGARDLNLHRSVIPIM